MTEIVCQEGEPFFFFNGVAEPEKMFWISQHWTVSRLQHRHRSKNVVATRNNVATHA